MSESKMLSYETATVAEKRIDTIAFFVSFPPLVCLSTWYMYMVWGWYAPLTGFNLPTLTYTNMFCLLVLKHLMMPSMIAPGPQKAFLMTQVAKAVIASTIGFAASWLVYRLFLA